MYCRIGHSNKHFVVKGQLVKKGDLVASVGDGNGQYKNQSHCHADFPKEMIWWTDYVFGISKEGVKHLYADPEPYRKICFPSYDHMGWGYLELATYGTKKCFHPGEDWNGKGAGNADLGDPIYSPFDGKIVLDYNDDKALNGGWGKLLVIQKIDPVEPPKPVEPSKPDPALSEPVIANSDVPEPPKTFEELQDPRNQLKQAINDLTFNFNKMKKVIEFLKGKKTISIGILMVALGILKGDTQMVMEGCGFIFLRLGIK